MDAEQLDFPDSSFDAVTVAFALFFLPDPERAAAEFHRVLGPRGRVAVSTSAERDDRWSWQDELLAAAGTPKRPPVQRPFDRAEDVIQLLDAAGFNKLRAHREEADIHFATEQDWWDWHWSFSLRGVLEQFDPAAVTAVRDASFARMATLRTAGGYPVHLNAWIVTGTANSSNTIKLTELFILVAPAPGLIRLGGLDNRVASACEVGRGVPRCR